MTPTERELLDTLIGVKKALTSQGDWMAIHKGDSCLVKAQAVIDKYQPKPKECCEEWSSYKETTPPYIRSFKFCPWCGSAKTKPVQALLCQHCNEPIERSATNYPPLWYHANDPSHSYRCRRGTAETLATPKEKAVQAEAQPVCKHCGWKITLAHDLWVHSKNQNPICCLVEPKKAEPAETK